MQKSSKQTLWQNICCVLSVALLWPKIAGVEATEFSGGRVTGPLLTITEIGIALFAVALLATFVYPRVAASIAIAAALLCLPFYLYFMAPGPFRRLFKGEYSVLVQASFVWNLWTVVGAGILAVTTYVCWRGLRISSRKEIPKPE
jgi:hypothetical protein